MKTTGHGDVKTAMPDQHPRLDILGLPSIGRANDMAEAKRAAEVPGGTCYVTAETRRPGKWRISAVWLSDADGGSGVRATAPFVFLS